MERILIAYITSCFSIISVGFLTFHIGKQVRIKNNDNPIHNFKKKDIDSDLEDLSEEIAKDLNEKYRFGIAECDVLERSYMYNFIEFDDGDMTMNFKSLAECTAETGALFFPVELSLSVSQSGEPTDKTWIYLVEPKIITR